MKLLLDENLPHQIRLELPGHEVVTVAHLGWGGVANGELLRLAAETGFDAILTNDRGLEYQQNLESLPLSVVVILAKSNTIDSIRPAYPALIDALSRLASRQFVKVEAP